VFVNTASDGNFVVILRSACTVNSLWRRPVGMGVGLSANVAHVYRGSLQSSRSRRMSSRRRRRVGVIVPAAPMTVVVAMTVIMATFMASIMPMAPTTTPVAMMVMAMTQRHQQKQIEADANNCNDKHQAPIDGLRLKEALKSLQH
jgi:hypothetical protein